MYLGVNFDGGTLDGQPMLLTNPPLLTGGSTGDSYSVTYEKVYQILAEDYILLVLYQPKKGQTVRIALPIPDGQGGRAETVFGWFRVDSVSLQREGSQIVQGDSTIIHVRVTMNLTMVTADTEGEYTEPWRLPPYNFKIGTENLEQSAWQFYNTENIDQVTGLPTLEPFVNTAGVPLQATTSRPLVRMPFSFNLEDIDPDWVYLWTGKINDDDVVICGIPFSAGQVKLESLSFEQMTETKQPTQEGGEPVDINYYKADAVFLIDPQTFERQYLNVGVHIKSGGGLRRLWTANYNGTTVYGTIDTIFNFQNPEEVSENMFLDSTGALLSGFGSDGRQIPTYRTGYLEELTDFGGVFPEAAPFYIEEDNSNSGS